MRKLLLFVWLLVPVAAAAYHYGPGQDLLAADRASSAQARGLSAAEEAEAIAKSDGDAAAKSAWSEAEVAFTEALEALPEGEVQRERALRLERAKAWMFLSKLPEARSELETLVRDCTQDANVEPEFLLDARRALANAQYYTTWLMRLEGATREEWEPEIESARQNYTLCVEAEKAAGDAEEALQAQHDLEAAIRLARMELSDLQGLPLPSQ